MAEGPVHFRFLYSSPRQKSKPIDRVGATFSVDGEDSLMMVNRGVA